MIYESLKDEDDEVSIDLSDENLTNTMSDSDIQLKYLLVLSIATSIDALA